MSRPVCVLPGRKPRRQSSRDVAQLITDRSKAILMLCVIIIVSVCPLFYFLIDVLFWMPGGILEYIYYWHKVKHILKLWYKFSHKLNQANLVYFFGIKEYFDPSILCIYS